MLRATGGDAPVTTGNYIDGVALPAEGGRTYALYNPARPDELVSAGLPLRQRWPLHRLEQYTISSH